MSDDPTKPRTDAVAELERQIRAERKFSLTEAIGRMAGPGAMKGVSPIDRKHQAVVEIQEYLTQHLTDAPGVLSVVLLRQVRESELLLQTFEQPLVALSGCVRHLLDSEYALKELVRQADVEWARVFHERPCFEQDGRPPAPNDPYTLDSVRNALTLLAQTLPAGQGEED